MPHNHTCSILFLRLYFFYLLHSLRPPHILSTDTRDGESFMSFFPLAFKGRRSYTYRHVSKERLWKFMAYNAHSLTHSLPLYLSVFLVHVLLQFVCVCVCESINKKWMGLKISPRRYPTSYCYTHRLDQKWRRGARPFFCGTLKKLLKHKIYIYTSTVSHLTTSLSLSVFTGSSSSPLQNEKNFKFTVDVHTSVLTLTLFFLTLNRMKFTFIILVWTLNYFEEATSANLMINC
jgi:uncharacterized C2H2 Zn-finger protein